MTPEDAALLAALEKEIHKKSPYFHSPVETPRLETDGLSVAVDLRGKVHILDEVLSRSNPLRSPAKSTTVEIERRNRWIIEAFAHLITKGRSGSVNECWPWPEKRTADGYGLIILKDGRKFLAHRVSYRGHKGIIPPGMEVMHQCDNPPCWNPRCLFLGTKSDNAQDAIRKGRR